MPILVHCPNGCLVRMPADRAGKMVRCSGCKAVISLPSLQESELRGGKAIPLDAILVQNFHGGTEQSHSLPTAESSGLSPSVIGNSLDSSRTTGIQNANEINTETSSEKRASIEESSEHPSNTTAASLETVPLAKVNALPKSHDIVDSTQLSPPLELMQQALPQILSPLQRQQIAEKAIEKRQKLVENFEPISLSDGSQEFRSSFVIRDGESDSSGNSGKGRHANGEAWRSRLQEANSNRVLLTKALATLVFVVGIINAAPAIFHWYQSWSAISSVPIPRWIYLQIFVAALHVLYAIFVFQISDWSSLRAVSVAMLAFAFGFGIIATALLIEGGHGSVSNFLSLSHRMVGNATNWTVSMLCLATLVAYVSGKEANDWKRAEQLLVEILNKNA